jgi:hypothetical protein
MGTFILDTSEHLNILQAHISLVLNRFVINK